MPLIKYFQYITLPDGSPASEMALPLQLLGGNVLVPLFSNKAGTTPLANPVMTDVDGLATFYAAPGDFVMELAGNVFHFFVDPAEPDDAWPGTFVFDQPTPALTWTIAHHFGLTPSVTVLVNGQVFEADVAHTNDSELTITFATPTLGVAHLRR